MDKKLTVANKKDGTVTYFAVLHLSNTKVGTHTYTVEEVCNKVGMTYDTMKVTITAEALRMVMFK